MNLLQQPDSEKATAVYHVENPNTFASLQHLDFITKLIKFAALNTWKSSGKSFVGWCERLYCSKRREVHLEDLLLAVYAVNKVSQPAFG